LTSRKRTDLNHERKEFQPRINTDEHRCSSREGAENFTGGNRGGKAWFIVDKAYRAMHLLGHECIP
jgi:hypothetical protein